MAAVERLSSREEETGRGLCEGFAFMGLGYAGREAWSV
jgi:hypothetical protein